MVYKNLRPSGESEVIFDFGELMKVERNNDNMQPFDKRPDEVLSGMTERLQWVRHTIMASSSKWYEDIWSKKTEESQFKAWTKIGRETHSWCTIKQENRRNRRQQSKSDRGVHTVDTERHV